MIMMLQIIVILNSARNTAQVVPRTPNKPRTAALALGSLDYDSNRLNLTARQEDPRPTQFRTVADNRAPDKLTVPAATLAELPDGSFMSLVA